MERHHKNNKALIEQMMARLDKYETVQKQDRGDVSTPEAIKDLEEEKKQLINKINSTKRKVDGEPGFEELLEVTQKLRLEQEEEMKLMTFDAS